MSEPGHGEFVDRYRIFERIPEFNPALLTGDEPLSTLYKELRTDKKMPFEFSEFTRRELENGPGVEILKPPGLQINNRNFTRALEIVTAQQIHTQYDLYAKGYAYSGHEVMDVDVKQIVGPSGKKSWGGLIEGMGKEDPHRPYSMEDTLRYAKYLFSSGKYELMDLTKNISLQAFDITDRGRQYFIDTNGQHRTLLFLAFSELGCEVKFRNMPVDVYKKST